MKSFKIFVLFVSILFTSFAFGQTGLNFQGVARNEAGVILASQELTLKLSILQASSSGATEYAEIRKTTTNAQGLFSVVIGGPNATSTLGSFINIDWKASTKFLKIEMDLTGGSNFTTIGITQLQSAAYAKYAESADASNLNGIVPIAKGGTGKATLEELKIALNLQEKANLASPTFTGTVSGISKTMVGLGNVDNTTDLNKPISTSTQTALDLKANVSQLTTKEEVSNKSTNVFTDAASDTKYPSVKAVKTFVDNAILSGVPDATTAVKGKIILAGALTGTADLPEIAANAIGTNQLVDASVSDAKITAINGTKIFGNISGSASNITGVVSLSNGGTGANNANDARANLGLTIGTNVEFPLSVASPFTRVSNTIAMPVASSGVNGYLSSTDWTNFNSKINASEKAANNGVATLGANGKIPSDQIPAISFQSANVVSSQSAMLALNGAVEGSIAIRTDNNKNYVLSTTPASTLSNWIELATPSALTSVNGAAGPNVVLTTDNIAEGSANKYYSNTQVRNAIGVTAPLTYDATTGGIALPSASTSQNGYLTSVDWNNFNNKQGSLTAGTGVTISSNTISIGQNVSTTANPIFASVNGINITSINNGQSIGIGNNSLSTNVTNTGFSNLALGNSTLTNNTTGYANTAIGIYSLNQSTAGFYNTGIGYGSLGRVVNGGGNTAIGGNSMPYTTGSYNTGIGYQSLFYNTTGSNNVAVGRDANLTNTTGSNNTMIGFEADATTGNLNNATAIGNQAKVNASNTIQLGNPNITDVKTAGKLTTGAITYPNTDGISGQVLSTTGAGTITWTTPSLNLVDLVSNQTVAGNKTFSADGSFNGVKIGRGGSSIETNTAIGKNALNAHTAGGSNTAIGNQALYSNINNEGNTAVGSLSLSSNTYGMDNTAVGMESLKSNTNGYYNQAFGYRALFSNTTASNNTAIGTVALFSNTTGEYNIGIGRNALIANTIGNKNVVIGVNSMDANVDGTENVGIGFWSNVASGSLNNAIAIGSRAIVNASNTIQLGNGDITDVKTAGKLTTGAITYPNTDGISGQVLSTTGSGTLTWTTPTTTDLSSITGVLSIAKGGTGTSTQNFVDLSADQTIAGNKTFSADGSFNGVKIGRGGGSFSLNTAIGAFALRNNTSGLQNTAIGSGALQNNLIGYSNTAVGASVLSQSNSGSGNTGIGASVMQYTTGINNTALGYQSLFYTTTGYNNVAVGDNAGLDNTTGSNNTLIGSNSNVGSNNLINGIAIGSNAIVNSSNTIQLGNGDITDVKTAGKLTTGAITYPNTDGISGQVLSTTGSGTITWTTPTITDFSNITGVLSIAKGGTGTSTQNFVDLSADQTIAGNKTFSSGIVSIGLSNRGSASSSIDFPHPDDPAFISHYTAGNSGRMSFSAGDDATVDYFAFGYGLQNSFTEKLKIYADGQLIAPVDAKINGLTIGMGKGSLIGNSAFGNTALNTNTSGQFNTAIGTQALKLNTTGSANTAIGNEALLNNISGGLNIAIGSSTLVANTSGARNTVVGTSAMYLNTTGSGNAVIGYHALNSNTIGNENVAIGSDALYGNVAGSGTIAIGVGAMRNANSRTTAHFSFNTAIGYEALRGSSVLSDNTGGDNTAFGAYTLRNNSTGFLNVAIGSSALTNNTIGNANIAVGQTALQTNIDGSYNVSIGQATLSLNTTGSYNTVTGTNALHNNTTGNSNTAIGNNILNQAESGNNNTAIGYNTGGGIIAGSNNTIVGANVNGLQDISNNIILANGSGAIKARHDGNNWSITGSVAIGTASPTASAALEVNSTTKGFLPPRMTTTQRDAISSPAEGLSIYNTTTKGYEYFNGTVWVATAHYVGESYGGGIVFYVYDNGQHGLIAANDYQSTGAYWRAGSDINTMALADGIGAGRKNTAIIIASQGYGNGDNYAARICNEYQVTDANGVTYGDWYLPSKTEALIMKNQSMYIPNYLFGVRHWTSSESSADSAYYMSNGTAPVANTKNNFYYVRAIRSF